jgi:glycosyltransferase involved in cell wall biosynthesis
VKFAVLAPPEIPIPLGDSYGGIEFVAQGFAEELSHANDVDLYCAPSKGVWPGAAAIRPYPQGPIPQEGYDFTFDFTHQKGLAKFYAREKYAATCFHTDQLSGVRDIFPTKAVRSAFGVEGPVIYPGIKNVYRYSEDKEKYLLFLGRIAPYKRPDIALLVAKMTGRPIILAGHVGKFSDWPEPGYAETIRRMVEVQRGAEMLSNVTLEKKVDLLSKAAALIVPSDWSGIGSMESFGIVAVEALMSGTPVITSGDGGLKEVVAPPIECGFVCRRLAEYIDAVRRLDEIKPKACEARGIYFSAERMAEDYLKLATGAPL